MNRVSNDSFTCVYGWNMFLWFFFSKQTRYSKFTLLKTRASNWVEVWQLDINYYLNIRYLTEFLCKSTVLITQPEIFLCKKIFFIAMEIILVFIMHWFWEKKQVLIGVCTCTYFWNLLSQTMLTVLYLNSHSL